MISSILYTLAKGGTFSTEGSIKFYDGDFISELTSLNLNTELVILSACETGVGSILKDKPQIALRIVFSPLELKIYSIRYGRLTINLQLC